MFRFKGTEINMMSTRLMELEAELEKTRSELEISRGMARSSMIMLKSIFEYQNQEIMVREKDY